MPFFNLQSSIPTPAVIYNETQDDFYDQAPMSVNPYTPAGFSNYEPQTPHHEFAEPPPPRRVEEVRKSNNFTSDIRK